jgi:hypothetical protein
LVKGVVTALERLFMNPESLRDAVDGERSDFAASPLNPDLESVTVSTEGEWLSFKLSRMIFSNSALSCASDPT